MRQVTEQVTRQVKNEVKIISKDQVDLDKEAILRGLSIKVDREDLEALDGKKANKKDTEDIMDAIRLLNQQMQQAVVLLNEGIRIQTFKPTDTKNAFDSKLSQLESQLASMNHWIQRQDPDDNLFLGSPRSSFNNQSLQDMSILSSWKNVELTEARQSLKSVMGSRSGASKQMKRSVMRGKQFPSVMRAAGAEPSPFRQDVNTSEASLMQSFERLESKNRDLKMLSPEIKM